MSYYLISKPDELIHYGIRGQKWGIRRFQNPDGTLTAEGKARYNTISDYSVAKKKYSRYEKTKAAMEQGQQKVIDRAKERLSTEFDPKKQAAYKTAIARGEAKMKQLANEAEKYYSLSPEMQKKVNSYFNSDIWGQVLFGPIGAIAGRAYGNAKIKKVLES